MTAWQVHKWWVMRTALVLLVTCSIDAAIGGLAAKPFPWVVLIPSTLPLSMICFLAKPLLKKEERESRTGARGRD
jgi:hypothetical protein